ncbi:cyanophycinase [Pedococcus dokdonensis]|uniref:Cyanophycinase n=1 Tax=Pedococcus dokdonensis TaxID=443156 RepID=A0A1H0RQ49_9MICO|nr:Type 1 glutamine amidotransferase-like domain-containing protein [Pedococcus dokdonensis]SDP31632.1 cyanophycinase [Pedococcus dokdonensis]
MGHSPHRPLLVAALAAALALPLAATASGAAVQPSATPVGETMAPIGGGYEEPSLEGFGRLSAQGASGPTVDLVVVPSAYGDKAKDRAENLVLAQERTDQIDAACDAVVAAPYTGCTARLAVLLNRKDAMDPANSVGIDSADGIYILGGDQGLAMKVLAASPAEAAMGRAAAAGATIGGTSAGAAVQSRNMINGYVGSLGPADGLQRGSTLMWWGDDADLERGLDFGSTQVLYDQHFYQRGRFGRLLSTLATSDERRGGASLLGLGVDYATGIHNTGDQTLSGVFGASSAAVVDLETLHSTHSWVGKVPVLSARNVLTHLLTPGTASYAIPTRTLTVDGAPVPPPAPLGWTAPATPGAGTLYLGGDLLAGDVRTGGLPAFVRTATAAADGSVKGARIVVVSASSGDTTTAGRYAAALKTAGWGGVVQQVTYGTPSWSSASLTGAAGVVVTAADPTTLAPAMADPGLRSLIGAAARTAPAFLADDHFAAAMGSWWSPKADPTSATLEDEGIAAFKSADGAWQPGLGLVAANVVPRLNGDSRWGRLYGLGQVDPAHLAVGLADGTAVALTSSGATVAGGSSAVVLDGRQATFSTAANGAIGATNVVLDVFGSGEVVTSAR